MAEIRRSGASAELLPLDWAAKLGLLGIREGRAGSGGGELNLRNEEERARLLSVEVEGETTR